MECGHDTMIGRKVTATISHAGSITKGKAYEVVDELWKEKFDLTRVTVISDDGYRYDLFEGEFR